MEEKDVRGITLIALIITIIVLLILAGVTIATLTGENGILSKTSIAKQETTKQGAKEKVQVEVMGSYGNDGKLNLDELNDNLKKNIEGLTYKEKPISNDNKIETLPEIVVAYGYNVKIHENGNVTIEEENEDIGETTTPPTPEVPEDPQTVAKSKEKNEPLSTTENTTILDDFGNQVIVPAGFKIGSESATDVTGGIVIEDVSHEITAGSEFVWIPVGIVYTNEAKTESKTINLSRYTFANDANGTPTEYGENVITINYKKEYGGQDINVDFTESTKSDLGNAVSLNMEEFKTKADKNHGYYIGRYEARTAVKAERKEANKDNGAQVTVRKNDYVYTWVTQLEATRLSQEMYNGESNITSDLINSYAWDTAIMFMQTFDNRTNKTKSYSRQNSLYTGLANQGTNKLDEVSKQDKICNIWDMASNSAEWTTESSNGSDGPCTGRGGVCSNNINYTASRYSGSITHCNGHFSFRVLLYI